MSPREQTPCSNTAAASSSSDSSQLRSSILVTDGKVNRGGRRDSRVSFGVVSMREYDRIVGDNPGGKTSGPPISIGWDFTEADEVSLHDHELYRKSAGKKDDGSILKPMSGTERTTLLRDEWCCTSDEITEATDEAIRIKSQREESNRALFLYRQAVQRVRDAGSSCRQTFDRLIRRNQKSVFPQVEYF